MKNASRCSAFIDSIRKAFKKNCYQDLKLLKLIVTLCDLIFILINIL